MAPVPGDSPETPVGTSMPQGGHPPHHSITSSARARSVEGTSRPRTLAAFRLITSSYLFGACTGRSAGFSPFRIRSTYRAARRYCSIRSGSYEIRPPALTNVSSDVLQSRDRDAGGGQNDTDPGTPFRGQIASDDHKRTDPFGEAHKIAIIRHKFGVHLGIPD
jgi:hypothetical protein